MESHTLQPAARPATPIDPTFGPAKHALYAWRSEGLYDDNGTPFRGICYSTNSLPMPGWVKVGAVGCLFGQGAEFGDSPLPPEAVPRPLVQFARRVTTGVAYTLELAPDQEGSTMFNEWIARRSARFSNSGEVLGYMLPPSHSEPGQLTRPLYSAQVRGEDGLPLNQTITTDRTTWRNFVAEVPTPFALESPVVDDVVPLGQIVPIFEVEIDLIGNNIVPTVIVGAVGPGMGDLVIPPGPGSMIRFSRQFDASFALDEIVVNETGGGGPAAGFSTVTSTDATILISNTAPAGLYDYTIQVLQESTGNIIVLDPKIRNRSTGGS